MENNSDKLTIGNKTFTSRLMLGTGKYKTTKDGIDSINSSDRCNNKCSMFSRCWSIGYYSIICSNISKFS